MRSDHRAPGVSSLASGFKTSSDGSVDVYLGPTKWAERDDPMKMITYATLAIGLTSALPIESNAIVCARGAYHAGCAGPRGAVGVNRG
jgi:hypothetical protein